MLASYEIGVSAGRDGLGPLSPCGWDLRCGCWPPEIRRRVWRPSDRIEHRSEQVERLLNARMVARREQVEQQTMQDCEHQGRGGLTATTSRLMQFIIAGCLTPAVTDCCVPPSAADLGLLIEQAGDKRQPLGD